MNNAVIDIGTNTLILLIAGTRGKKISKIVADTAVITRLGQGVYENHFLSQEAMLRTKKTLKVFLDTCKQHKVKKIVATGTAALRAAANAEVFLSSVKKELGINIRVITGKQEAELIFASAWEDFGGKKKQLIVVDIGGGSTEIITGPLGANKSGPQTALSLPIGSVRLTEQFIRHDPVYKDEMANLINGICGNLQNELGNFYPVSFNPDNYQMIATAGTATTLAAVDMGVTAYSRSKIHGVTLKAENLQKMIGRLARLDIKGRQALPGMEPLRADVILTGGLLLYEIMRYFKKKETRISDGGLRYGVFYKYILKK